MPTASATKTFVITDGGKEIELVAERAEQSTIDSRVTFYIGEEAVGSFLNISNWYTKPAA
jgi:hypothetical protein